MWDVIDDTRPKAVIAIQIKKKKKDNAIATKIIKWEVNGDLYINIIGGQDPYRS